MPTRSDKVDTKARSGAVRARSLLRPTVRRTTSVWPDADVAEQLACTIAGRRLSARPRGDWERGERSDASLQAVGSLTLDGRDFVLLASPELGPSEAQRQLASLTGRELQIAHRIRSGLCDKVIAHELGISEYTVREHVRRIFHKLGVCKRTAVVRIMCAGV